MIKSRSKSAIPVGWRRYRLPRKVAKVPLVGEAGPYLTEGPVVGGLLHHQLALELPNDEGSD